jgi:hypothetical protein
MAAIPTFAEEDAKRPTREHENLVAERTRHHQPHTAAPIRLGIRNFNVMLVKAAQYWPPRVLRRCAPPEGEALPPNTLAELRSEMARLSLRKGCPGGFDRAPRYGHGGGLIYVMQVLFLGATYTLSESVIACVTKWVNNGVYW